MVYPITIIFSVFFAWLASRVKNKSVIILCSIISVLIPSIVGGLRSLGIGIDTMGYGIGDANRAEIATSYIDFMSTSYREPVYGLVCYVTMKTLGHVNWCFFFYQLITVGCFYIGAYKHRNIAPLPMFMCSFLSMFYFTSYSAMRQCMAASIIFMGIDNLEKNKYGKFLFYVALATTFHFSSVLSIILVFIHMISTLKNSQRHAMISIAILFFMFIRYFAYFLVRVIPFFPARYINYFATIDSGNTVGGVLVSLTLIYIGQYILFTLYSNGGKKLLGQSNFEFYKLNILFYLACHLIINLNDRMTWFFRYIDMIAISCMPFFIKDKYTRILVIGAVIFMLITYCYRTHVIGNWYETWPYISILD